MNTWIGGIWRKEKKHKEGFEKGILRGKTEKGGWKKRAREIRQRKTEKEDCNTH